MRPWWGSSLCRRHPLFTILFLFLLSRRPSSNEMRMHFLGFLPVIRSEALGEAHVRNGGTLKSCRSQKQTSYDTSEGYLIIYLYTERWLLLYIIFLLKSETPRYAFVKLRPSPRAYWTHPLYSCTVGISVSFWFRNFRNPRVSCPLLNWIYWTPLTAIMGGLLLQAVQLWLSVSFAKVLL